MPQVFIIAHSILSLVGMHLVLEVLTFVHGLYMPVKGFSVHDLLQFLKDRLDLGNID